MYNKTVSKMKKDIIKILEICKSKGVILHETYNEKLFDNLVGSSDTEDIAFAEMILAMVDLRRDWDSHKTDVLDLDWWEVVPSIRPLAQLFAQVNDIAVRMWNGYLEDVVVEFILYKAFTENLEVE